MEFSVDEIAKLKMAPSFSEVESMEVISFLRSTPEEVTSICRIKFKTPHVNLRKAFAGHFAEVQVLEQGEEGYVFYMRSRRPRVAAENDPLGPRVYLTPPFEVHDGLLRATFVASAREIKRILRIFGRSNFYYRVVSLTDARFLPNSPLGQLTGKQRDVILTAFKKGYYDVPRSAGSEELAKQLGIREPTFVMHRRKAEKKLLSAIIGER